MTFWILLASVVLALGVLSPSSATNVRPGFPGFAPVTPTLTGVGTSNSSPPNWTELLPTSAPSPRYGAALAFDPIGNYTLLFGGAFNPFSGGYVHYGDTWIYRSGGWTNLTSTLSVAPPARKDAGVAYDAADGYIVMFGGDTGANGSVYLNDTWVFQNMAWHQIFSSTSPSPRSGLMMTFDARDSYVLLFGGCTATCSPTPETWKYRAGEWSPVTTTGGSPPVRAACGLAYDANDGYVLMFGGWNVTDRFNETWSYAGGQWTQLHPPSAPSPRLGVRMAYLPEANAVVAFGGKFLGNVYGDTWLFRGGTWTNITSLLTVAPSPRDDNEGLVYYPPASGLFMFGGQATFPGTLADTWLFTDSSASNGTTPPPTSSTNSPSSASNFLLGVGLGAVVGATAAGILGFMVARRYPGAGTFPKKPMSPTEFP
ncbi:MAG: hypothetical protein ABSB97_02270 [Thermoplasmata archaeon]